MNTLIQEQETFNPMQQSTSLDAPSKIPTGTWRLDPNLSSINFSIKKMLVWTVHGSFRFSSGTIDVANPIERSSVDISIDAQSFKTATSMRDKHVRSDDFLNVEEHPLIAFTSKVIQKTPHGWDVTGDLTVAGQSRRVTLNAHLDEPMSDDSFTFHISTVVKRSEFGVGKMAPMVSDDLHLEINGVVTR